MKQIRPSNIERPLLITRMGSFGAFLSGVGTTLLLFIAIWGTFLSGSSLQKVALLESEVFLKNAQLQRLEKEKRLLAVRLAANRLALELTSTYLFDSVHQLQDEFKECGHIRQQTVHVWPVVTSFLQKVVEEKFNSAERDDGLEALSRFFDQCQKFSKAKITIPAMAATDAQVESGDRGLQRFISSIFHATASANRTEVEPRPLVLVSAHIVEAIATLQSKATKIEDEILDCFVKSN